MARGLFQTMGRRFRTVKSDYGGENRFPRLIFLSSGLTGLRAAFSLADKPMPRILFMREMK